MTKRLIEDILPLGELNKYAQKGGGIGSLNAMHPYFSRRPLTASRADGRAARRVGQITKTLLQSEREVKHEHRIARTELDYTD